MTGVTPHSLQFLSVVVIVALTVALVAGYRIYIINLENKKDFFFFHRKGGGESQAAMVGSKYTGRRWVNTCFGNQC